MKELDIERSCLKTGMVFDDEKYLVISTTEPKIFVFDITKDFEYVKTIETKGSCNSMLPSEKNKDLKFFIAG